MNISDSLSVKDALQKFPGAAPFTFAMVDSKGRILRLSSTEVINTLYGKRGVFRVFWQGREAAAKVYAGRSALRESRTEARAYKLLRQAGFPTPELLHAAEGADRRSALLLFAWLQNALPLSTALVSAERMEEKIQLAEKMLNLIMTMRRRGLLQRDPHAGNFLFCGEYLYIVDLGRVFPFRCCWTSNSNLIKMLNCQPVSIRPALLHPLEKKHRLKLHPWQLDLRWRLDQRKRRRKVRRGRGNLVLSRTHDRLLAHYRNHWSEALQKTARTPEAAAARGKILQQTEGRRTVRTAAEDGGLILQCYGPPQGLQALCPSRAWRCWLNRNLLAAGARGDLHLPETLVCIEERRGPFRGRSWLAHKPTPGESLAAVTRTSPPPDFVDESLRKMFIAFYTLRALPQDLRAEGFIVQQEGKGRVFFTALEDVQFFHRRSACRRAWPAMQQAFLSNWPAAHPCHARYREMLEAIPRESPF